MCKRKTIHLAVKKIIAQKLPEISASVAKNENKRKGHSHELIQKYDFQIFKIK